MKNNNIIRLNENELFNLIKENVRKVLREYSYDTAEMQIEVGDLDLPEELYELLEDNYEYVTVKVEYEIEPYCSGDWDTPPSGGCAEIHNYTIDPYGDFKNIIPKNSYQLFIDEVEKAISRKWDDFCIELYNDYENQEPPYEDYRNYD